ncbi:MAG TPA: site-specific DNA-methyltransferase [Pyrinomonadaceae bacterium]|nr:site-specific DNA-methyltransferase [Pyrinomonadaceae bacterium]
MKNSPLPRLDTSPEVREKLLPYCRLKRGDIWTDGKHKVGCLDASDRDAISALMEQELAVVAVHDPPYNLVAFQQSEVGPFIKWSREWIETTLQALKRDSSLYIWLGADQNNGFQPLPDFMLMMREMSVRPRSFITMRNQRGYGTQNNWMAVRQELLYYVRGNPSFDVEAEYTDIPKILRGYYKEVNGSLTENLERGKSENIRAGNVWVDVQQVFYRMEENVSGCYAQKPLKAIERIIKASSNNLDLVLDFFSHSGSTLLATEMLNRRCYTIDIDPLFCEITIRRLEHYRSTGRTGWQNSNPFAIEVKENPELRRLVSAEETKAEDSDVSLPHRRSGQPALFG